MKNRYEFLITSNVFSSIQNSLLECEQEIVDMLQNYYLKYENWNVKIILKEKFEK